MLARRHNGSGMLPYPEEVKALLSEAIDRHPDIRFSVKLRLGWEQAEECLALLPLFNELPLAHIILHPRLGKQQYKGEVDLEGFEAFYKECTHPLLYNGDLHTVEDIRSVTTRFPDWQASSSVADCSPILPYRWNTSKEPRFLPMKWRKSGATAHRSVRQLPGATARRRHATADENEKLLGISAAGRRP